MYETIIVFGSANCCTTFGFFVVDVLRKYDCCVCCVALYCWIDSLT